MPGYRTNGWVGGGEGGKVRRSVGRRVEWLGRCKGCERGCLRNEGRERNVQKIGTGRKTEGEREIYIDIYRAHAMVVAK